MTNRMVQFRAILLACTLAAVSCASAPVARDFDRSITVDDSEAATWDALTGYLAGRGWPVESVERDSGVITTEWVALPSGASRYMDCGRNPLSNARDHEFRVNAVVRGDGRRSSVTLTTSHRAALYSMIDVRQGEVDCVSTGALEREVFDALGSSR